MAEERPGAEHAKAAKDLRQAGLLARALEAEGRLGELSLAGKVLAARGKGWGKRARAAVARLAREDGQAAGLLRKAVP